MSHALSVVSSTIRIFGLAFYVLISAPRWNDANNLTVNILIVPKWLVPIARARRVFFYSRLYPGIFAPRLGCARSRPREEAACMKSAAMVVHTACKACRWI